MSRPLTLFLSAAGKQNPLLPEQGSPQCRTSGRKLALVSVLLWLVATSATVMARPLKVHYDVAVRIDPATRKLEGRSEIRVDGSGDYKLLLNGRFNVTSILLDGEPLKGRRSASGGLQGWRLPEAKNGTRRINLEWSGTLAALDTTLDHRRVLMNAEPVTGAQGTFLPDASAWYPRIAGVLASYQLLLELPAHQRGLVPGRLVEEVIAASRYRARFEFRLPAEGIDLMAGPYEVEQRMIRRVGGKRIRLRTYFHPSIAELAPAYLDSVQAYIEMYESWIGDYPYTEFSVVSSPTPTGFGMPTLTYLGINVLRLPFIRSTSLGHEVLHNWWGNGVYPYYASGNWSEGLTTFMADYAYKERESPEAAREMRLEWLRDFSAVPLGQDLPLAKFNSRTHGTSQIVGYHKSAMLFFMLRDLIGREEFDRGIRAFWQKHRFNVATWDEVRGAFETASGADLKPFFDQWLRRSGAPVVRIVSAKSMPSGGGYRLTVRLNQRAPAYRLGVPLEIRTEKGVETRIVDVDAVENTFNLQVSARPSEIAFDPELRVFRRLARDEAPPILRQVMVDPTTLTALLSEEGEARRAANSLAIKLQDHAPRPFSPDRALRRAPALVIGLEGEIDQWLKEQRLPGRPDVVKGKGTAQAWTAGRDNGGAIAVVSAMDTEALAALARPLPHYGRQSYVIFEGSKMIERGTWPARVQLVKVVNE